MFLVRISAALHSDLQEESIRLKQRNSYLQSKVKIQTGIDGRANEADRSRRRRQKQKEKNIGGTRGAAAEGKVVVSKGMHSWATLNEKQAFALPQGGRISAIVFPL